MMDDPYIAYRIKGSDMLTEKELQADAQFTQKQVEICDQFGFQGIVTLSFYTRDDEQYFAVHKVGEVPGPLICSALIAGVVKAIAEQREGRKS